MLAEDGERHRRAEGLDRGGEGLTTPDGGNEGLTCEEVVCQLQYRARTVMWRPTIEELLVKLGQLLISLRRVGDQQLIDDPITEHQTHHMPQQALHHNAQSRVIKALLSETEQEGRVVDGVDVGVESFGKGNEGEMSESGNVGAGGWRRGGASVGREGVGRPAIDAPLETGRRVLDGELEWRDI